MQGRDPPHLGYCTNIHPGETWPEVRALLEEHVLEVKRRACPDRPFGVGLRLSRAAVDELHERPLAREELRDLTRRGAYVFTLNAFVMGIFHRTRVKEGVYVPDWSDPARLAYTNRAAETLASILPDGVSGSVSTVPLGFGALDVLSAERRAAMASHLVDHAAFLAALEDRTGKTVRLGLEPEPFCLLETTEDAVCFFAEDLHSRTAVTRFVSTTGKSAAEAERCLRRHLGVCLDACHAAVVFEDPRAAVERLHSAGIPIAKLQVTAALETDVDEDTRRELERFADDVYLHQAVERADTSPTPTSVRRFVDLPEALASIDGCTLQHPDRTLRVHFHVPVFAETLGRFRSTQPHLREVLAAARGLTEHYEVETYTWDVLPEAYRPATLHEAIARELAWTEQELGLRRETP